MASFYTTELQLNLENISQERLDGELILISFETGKYFSSTGSGADIFFLIQHQVPQSNWFEILGNAYKNASLDKAAMSSFLQHSLDEQLLVSSDDELTNHVQLPQDFSRGDWADPKLVAFEDLQNLLLIDPIHDTDTEGWPKLKDEK
jgi:hypothetical protein